MRSTWSLSPSPEIDIMYADVSRTPPKDDILTRNISKATTPDQRTASGRLFTELPLDIHLRILSHIPDPFNGIQDTDDRTDFERKVAAKLARVSQAFWAIYHPKIYQVYIVKPDLGLNDRPRHSHRLLAGEDQSKIEERLWTSMVSQGFTRDTGGIRRLIALRQVKTLTFEHGSFSPKNITLPRALREGAFVHLRTVVLEPMSVVRLSQLLSMQTTRIKPVCPLPSLSDAPIDTLKMVFPSKGMDSTEWEASTRGDIYDMFAKHLLLLFPKLRYIQYLDVEDDNHPLHFAPSLHYLIRFRHIAQTIRPLATPVTRQRQIERYLTFPPSQRRLHLNQGTTWRFEKTTAGIYNPRVAVHRAEALEWVEGLTAVLKRLGRKSKEKDGKGWDVQVANDLV